MKPSVITTEDFDHISQLSRREQRDYLFLDVHPKYAGRWYVESLDGAFMFDFQDVIGKYRTVSPASLKRFLDLSEELGYRVYFLQDPEGIFTAWEHLNDPPPFSLNSDLPGTIEGFLPFQLQGFNYLRTTDKRGGYAVWSTGTGKTALIAGLIKQHMFVEDAYDFGLVVVKSSNKTDMCRKLDQLGDIGSIMIDGPLRKRDKDGFWIPGKRDEIYGRIDTMLGAGIKTVAVTNYEKFREDQEYLQLITQNRRLLVLWDEMPEKLSNRTTQLYDAVRSVLYDSSRKEVDWEKRRPSALRQYGFSATPIKNTPLGILNQIRLIDPGVWPTIKGWEKKYVASRNPLSHEPETFHDLDQIGLEIEFMTHQVDKADPDIAKMFPAVMEETVYIDWGADRSYYDKLVAIAKDMAKKANEGEGKKFNALQMIGALQMICDAPSMINTSAQNREVFDAILTDAEIEGEEPQLGGLTTGSEAAQALARAYKHPLTNDKSAKLEKLHEILTKKHPSEKIVVFTAFAEYIFPILERKLQEWGVTFATFRGSDKQRQEAKDQFRTDPAIRVFLSSDAGSDSIDLPEASVVVHFDLPWAWTTLVQRQNRAHRINSKHERVIFYTLLMANSVEDRKVEIISKKLGFHRGIFKGEIAEEAISARMTTGDLQYILTGERPDDMLYE